jgi:hypothetical protein
VLVIGHQHGMKSTRSYTILLLSVLLFNCEDVFNCIIPREPELQNKEFPIGNMESYYYVDLRAEINNEPRDDDYDYFFEVSGLPEGLDYFVNFRTISIEGDALERGVFNVTIFLEVDGPFRDDFQDDVEVLCDYSTSKTYTLIIE